MAFTSRDETDLLLPLLQGVHETPRFSTFLERVRRKTGAEHVGLIIRAANAPDAHADVLHAGIDLHERAITLEIGEIFSLESSHHANLRPSRVYSVSEFVDHDPEYKARRAEGIERLGIADERAVRVLFGGGNSATLVLGRAKSCSAADSALLSNLAPYVAAALDTLNLMDKRRVEHELSAKGLERLGIGWILFDQDARVVAIDTALERRIAQIMGSAPRAGERLHWLGPQKERELAAAAAAFARSPDSAPQSLLLSDDPRIEAVLRSADTLGVAQAMLALCRLPHGASPNRAGSFAELFSLPPREAELAIALSDGLSLAEAAQAMNLTLETARNYSKRLYAKLDVRGQGELVRLVYESSAILA